MQRTIAVLAGIVGERGEAGGGARGDHARRVAAVAGLVVTRARIDVGERGGVAAVEREGDALV